MDLSDLYADPVVMHQKKFFLPYYLVLVFWLPTYMSMNILGIPFVWAFFVTCLRFVYVLHTTCLVNSAAHLYGDKPYDESINPGELFHLSPVLFVGEAYHNYHHTFPGDYRASEFGWFGGQWNLSAFLIDFWAKIGWAYDLKSASPKIIEARKSRTGQKKIS